MEFAKQEDARRTALGHEITLKNIEKHARRFTAVQGPQATFSDSYYEVLKRFQLEQNGRFTIFSALFSTEWLTDQIDSLSPFLFGRMDVSEEQ